MRCFNVLGTRVSKGITPITLRDTGDLGFVMNREVVPMAKAWSDQLKGLLAQDEWARIRNAHYESKVVPIKDDEEVDNPVETGEGRPITQHIIYTQLVPVSQRIDKDGRALLLVRPEKTRKGKRVPTTYSSIVCAEVEEKGIIVRKYQDISTARGVTVCLRREPEFILILEPGASFRMKKAGPAPNEFYFQWNASSGQIEVERREPLRRLRNRSQVSR